MLTVYSLADPIRPIDPDRSTAVDDESERESQYEFRCFKNFNYHNCNEMNSAHRRVACARDRGETLAGGEEHRGVAAEVWVCDPNFAITSVCTCQSSTD